MKFIKALKKRIPKWLFWSTMFFTGLIIIIFNDAFGESEPFVMFAFVYFIFFFFVIIRWTFKQIKSIIQLKNEKKKTELLHLKSQINPHFFFNMLNNLYGWVEKDSKKAQELILKLSDMMRYSVYDGQKEKVTLEEEVAYIQNYIELHEMRYHKQIDIKFDVDLQESGYTIMPLLFIILVENAFKHGVEELREGAFVTIKISDGNGNIYFEITNNFDDSQKSDTSTGIGLKNLRRRLEIQYPKKHELSFNESNNIFKAKLILKT